MDVTSILKKYPQNREHILEILHEIQDSDSSHHLSKDALKKVAAYLNLPLAQVYGVVGYYSMFSTQSRGKFLVRVCKSPVCNLVGNQRIVECVKSAIEKISASDLFTIEETECLGHCGESPCMMVNQTIYGNLTPEKIEFIVNGLKSSL